MNNNELIGLLTTATEIKKLRELNLFIFLKFLEYDQYLEGKLKDDVFFYYYTMDDFFEKLETSNT